MFKFIQDGDDVSVEMRIDEGATWWELSERFVNFLQASGFVVDRQDFAEYWADELDVDQYPDDEEEPVSISLSADPNDTFTFDGINTLKVDDGITVSISTDTSPGQRAFATMADTLGGHNG